MKENKLKKWHFSSGRHPGLSRKQDEPNEDSVIHAERDGVQVIVLSDGSGSSLYAAEGSRMIVETVSELFLTSFDDIYENVPRTKFLELIALKIQEAQLAFIEEHAEVKEEIHLYNERKQVDFAAFEKDGEDGIRSFYLKEFYGTLLLVAIKGERKIVAHFGDGMIGAVRHQKIEIISEEAKTDNVHQTLYPMQFLTTFLYWEEKYERFPSSLFKTEAPYLTGFILFSDGNDGLVIDEYEKGKRLSDDVYDIFNDVLTAETQEAKDALMAAWAEKETKRSRYYDDCSIAVFVHDDFAVNKKDGFIVKMPPEKPQEPEKEFTESEEEIAAKEAMKAAEEEAEQAKVAQLEAERELAENIYAENKLLVKKHDERFLKEVILAYGEHHEETRDLVNEYATYLRNESEEKAREITENLRYALNLYSGLKTEEEEEKQ